jgi:hypothetical protein
VLWGYLNFLVGSGRNLLFASALWIVLFAGAYDVLVTATIAEHRRLQEWQSIHLKAAKIQRSRPTLQIEDVIGDLRFDYFSYWLPQSAATFVGMHQFLEGGLHPALISDFVSLNADEDRRRITEHIETPFSPHITHIRILLKTWWFLVVCEMALGYTHLAAAVTLMLARFSRK